jgi:hypothetical protein
MRTRGADVARGVIYVMIAIMALLAWRDVVAERQLDRYVLATREQPIVWLHDRVRARDAALDEAMWALLTSQPDRAIATVNAIDEQYRELPFTGLPGSIRLAARCVRGDRFSWVKPPLDTPEKVFCEYQQRQRALNKHDGGIVQK